MSNDILRSEINNLERKVKLLLNEYSQMISEMDALKKENSELKAQFTEKETTLANFQNQTKISRIVESMAVGDNNAGDLKEVLDEYIQEIDKCIAHLGEA
ncbi:MAG: hypothetical protein JXR10_11885 [Cyclobacteriaceae bacterium]